jgi:hypothetical protein
MTSRFFHQAGSLAALTAMLLSVPSLVRAQGTGGLGSVSTCPAAPEITATAVSYLLSPQSGLSLFHANAAAFTVVRQACISSPNLAPQIARQAVQAVSRSAAAAANRSAALANGTSSADALASPAAVGVSATTGYSETINRVLRGAIQGCASTGMTTTDLKNILSAVCSAIVIESAKQAGASAALSQKGPLPVEKSLPMDNAQNAVAVIKGVVETFSKTAAALGIPQIEIAGSINLAGQEAMETAKNINADTIATEVSSLAAGQMARDVALQVALQVAQQVAKEVAAQITAQVYWSGLGSQKGADQNQSQPGAVPPTIPGIQPGPFPNPPVPTPTPFPTPPPTPVPTPAPPSRR